MQTLNKLLISLLLLCLSHTVCAETNFTGPDLSGIYECTGVDNHEGKYSGTVTIALILAQSTKHYGAYSFKLEVPGFGTYLGQAAARGLEMAVHFVLTDQTTKDYGTGIASFKKNKTGKWAFNKYYYEPEFKGGNFGMEDCTQR